MLDIKQKLQENSELVEERLKRYLDKHDEKLELIYDIMRYSALDGGKRIRPFLVMEFSRMYGGNDEAAIPFACAIEMVHCYSLVHDDLPCMDNDEYRRGKLTCHKMFGEANAVLGGDALLTYAFNVAAANDYVNSSFIRSAILTISECAGCDGMIGGQILDLIGEKEKFDYNTLQRMNLLKTGQLIRCAAVLGCLAAGNRNTDTAEKYAYNVGLAFQIIDDILDAGTDGDKTTFLSFMSIEDAKKLAENLLREARDLVNSEPLKALCDYLLDRKS